MLLEEGRVLGLGCRQVIKDFTEGFASALEVRFHLGALIALIPFHLGIRLSARQEEERNEASGVSDLRMIVTGTDWHLSRVVSGKNRQPMVLVSRLLVACGNRIVLPLCRRR